MNSGWCLHQGTHWPDDAMLTSWYAVRVYFYLIFYLSQYFLQGSRISCPWLVWRWRGVLCTSQDHQTNSAWTSTIQFVGAGWPGAPHAKFLLVCISSTGWTSNFKIYFTSHLVNSWEACTVLELLVLRQQWWWVLFSRLNVLHNNNSTGLAVMASTRHHIQYSRV